MLHNPTFWVATAFVSLIALMIYKKVPGIIAGKLDARSAKIQAELEQAQNLRLEAEKVLEEYKRKQAEYLKDAQDMLVKARKDADALRAQAEEELKQSLEARTKHAMERIAQEENKAIEDVRNHVVDIALAAARAMITEQAGNASADLIKLALSDIERKIH